MNQQKWLDVPHSMKTKYIFKKLKKKIISGRKKNLKSYFFSLYFFIQEYCKICGVNFFLILELIKLFVTGKDFFFKSEIKVHF